MVLLVPAKMDVVHTYKMTAVFRCVVSSMGKPHRQAGGVQFCYSFRGMARHTYSHVEIYEYLPCVRGLPDTGYTNPDHTTRYRTGGMHDRHTQQQQHYLSIILIP